MSARALVTGAGGFVGRVLCQRLAADGIDVTALHRRSANGPWSREILHDLAAGPPPASAVDGVERVFHLAGHAHAEERRSGEDLHHATSVEGTRHLLEALGDAPARMLYLSSVKAVGESTPPEGIDETATPHPTTAYGRARLAAEQLVLAASAWRHVVVLRLPLVYGPGVKGNLARMLVAADAGRMPLLPDFGNRRSMIHVDDVCRAALAAIDCAACNGKVYFLSDGVPYAPRQIQVLMHEALGRGVPLVGLPRWLLRVLSRVGDAVSMVGLGPAPLDSQALERLTASAVYRADAARADFGFRPRSDLRAALPAMVRVLRSGDTC